MLRAACGAVHLGKAHLISVKYSRSLSNIVFVKLFFIVSLCLRSLTFYAHQLAHSKIGFLLPSLA